MLKISGLMFDKEVIVAPEFLVMITQGVNVFVIR